MGKGGELVVLSPKQDETTVPEHHVRFPLLHFIATVETG
jgi:hypothetical protein